MDPHHQENDASDTVNEIMEQLRNTAIVNEALTCQNRELNERLRVLEEASRLAPASVQPTATTQRKATKWPVWDGKVDSFKTHAYLLRVKIEEDKAILGTNRAICMEIFNSLPADKRPRVAHWFESGGPDGDYDWEVFLFTLKEKFEDKQAKQTAGDQLSRMRMGATQYFADYLQDFEFKLSLCDGLGWPDRTKIIYLNTSINSKLKEKLVSKSLPDDDYTKWTKKVSDVASRLENLPLYRSKDSTTTKTWYLSPVGCGGKLSQDTLGPENAPKVDADGDTPMIGMSGLSINALTSLINAIQGNGKGERQLKRKDKRPRAPWRTPDEIRKLAAENKCYRCEKIGHLSSQCRAYRPPERPKAPKVNNMEIPAGMKIAEARFEDSPSGSGED
jgi:hypothetical protein